MIKVRTPVSSEEWLFRRGHSNPEHKYMNPDGSAHSRVFKLRAKDIGELSVDVKSMTTPEVAVVDSSCYMLFEVANIDVIDMGLVTEHDPLPVNSSHAVILGMTEEDEVLPGLLARKARRVYI